MAAGEETGEFTGTILFSGSPAKNKNFNVNLDQEICGTNVEVVDIVLNPRNHGVKNVFISLKSKFEQIASSPSESVVLDNLKCHISPSVLGLEVNEIFSIKNSDPIFHSIQFLQKDNFLFNVALPKGGVTVKKNWANKELFR